MEWQPAPVPSDLQALPGFLQRELAEIAGELARMRHVEFLNVAPTKPREGMLYGADGVNWNPGEGQGVYAYFGGAWKLVSGHYSFGEMQYGGTPVVVTVSAANTAYELTSGLVAGTLVRTTFGGAHYVQVADAGKYAVTYSAALEEATPNDVLASGVMINGTAQTQGHFHAVVTVSSKAVTLSGSAVVTLAAADQVSLFVENHTSAANITVSGASLVLHRLF